MIYIVLALKAEAQAFVDRYRLSKKVIENITIFFNNEIVVFVSGIGVENILRCCDILENSYELKKEDIFINIGICGANTQYKIGDFLDIGKIQYRDKLYTIDNSKELIICVDKEIFDDIYTVVDMESYGFYSRLKRFDNLYIFKVVSDNFEPKTVTKDKTKNLIFCNIETMIKKVKDDR